MNTQTIMQVIWLVTCLVTTVTANGFQVGAPSENFYNQNLELDQKISQLENRQAISEGRQAAITQSYNQEMTKLSQDAQAAKTVITRLVEDSVKLEGKMRILQDLGLDVRGIRNQVSNMKKDMSTKMTREESEIARVSHNLEKVSSANTFITAKLSTQMKNNEDILTEMRQKTRSQDAKTTALETKLSQMEASMSMLQHQTPAQVISTPAPVDGTNLQTQIKDLTGTVDSLKLKLGGEIEKFNGLIAELQGQLNALMK